MTRGRLEFADQPGRQRVVVIDRSPFTIGRSHDNALTLNHADISREHAQIVREGAQFRLCDRGSRAGTFVNDAPVQEHTLRHGDRIRIGQVDLRFLVGDDSDTTDRTTATSIVGDLHHMAALLQGLRALGSARLLDQVLAIVLDSAITLSSAERGFIMLADDSRRLEFKMGRDRRRETLPGRGFETSRKIPEEVFTTRQPRVVADLRGDLWAADHAGTVALGIRNVLCVPLKLVRYADTAASGAGADDCIGVLYLDSREKGALQSRSMLAGLETLAMEAAVAIDNARLYRESQEKAQLERELQMARDFQQALLPQAAPQRSFLSAAATMVPCLAIGGDFFEYLDLGEAGIAFAVGDVAGKGVAAGLLAARVQEIFATHGSSSRDPASTVLNINRALVRRGLEARFVTLFYGVLAPDGRFAYCNAGHNPPIFVRPDGIRRLDVGGTIVGLFPEAEFEQAQERMVPGDQLVVFSDGIPEASDGVGREYGDRRIVERVLAQPVDAEPRAVVDGLFASVREFTGGQRQTDDMTVLVVRYRGEPLTLFNDPS